MVSRPAKREPSTSHSTPAKRQRSSDRVSFKATDRSLPRSSTERRVSSTEIEKKGGDDERSTFRNVELSPTKPQQKQATACDVCAEQTSTGPQTRNDKVDASGDLSAAASLPNREGSDEMSSDSGAKKNIQTTQQDPPKPPHQQQQEQQNGKEKEEGEAPVTRENISAKALANDAALGSGLACLVHRNVSSLVARVDAATLFFSPISSVSVTTAAVSRAAAAAAAVTVESAASGERESREEPNETKIFINTSPNPKKKGQSRASTKNQTTTVVSENEVSTQRELLAAAAVLSENDEHSISKNSNPAAAGAVASFRCVDPKGSLLVPRRIWRMQGEGDRDGTSFECTDEIQNENPLNVNPAWNDALKW